MLFSFQTLSICVLTLFLLVLVGYQFINIFKKPVFGFDYLYCGFIFHLEFLILYYYFSLCLMCAYFSRFCLYLPVVTSFETICFPLFNYIHKFSYVMWYLIFMYFEMFSNHWCDLFLDKQKFKHLLFNFQH